jgi:hypothetical protein
MSAGVAVIVLNWNGSEDTQTCLRSLERTRSEWSQCIVVDNGSVDGSVEAVRGAFPWAQIIETGSNLGYAAGNNVGIRAALEDGATTVLVLNNDAVVAPGVVRALSAVLERDSTIGLAGPAIRHDDAEGRFWYAGGRIVLSPFRSRWVSDVSDTGTPFDVDYVPGCALAASRRVLETIGLFDERYFLTWEDSDLGTRARDAGFRCTIVPNVAIGHRGSASFGGSRSALYSYYYFRNMLLYARLHVSGARRYRAYRDTAGLAWRTIQRERRAPRLRLAITLGFVHFAARRFGAAPRWLAAEGPRKRLENSPRPIAESP